MKWIALVALVLTQFACATSSSNYSRTTARSGELVWAFDGELKVMQNGRVVSGADWSGLSDAVSCVPRAARLASKARSNRVRGKATAWVGAITMLAAVGAGTYLVIDDTDNLSTGLIVMGAGSAAGLTALVVGAGMLAHSDPKAIDAVNVYNDQHQATVGCATGAASRSVAKGR